MTTKGFLTLSAGLALLAPSALPAATFPYQIQRVLQVGGKVGDMPLPSGLIMVVGPLSDSGQLLIDAGSLDESKPDLVLQYAGGTFTPVVEAGVAGPEGPWPKDVFFFGPGPQSMNRQGEIVFAVKSKGSNPPGTFRWDPQTHTTTPVALTGMPAVEGYTFTAPYGGTPAINNQGEIAFPAMVKSATGPSGAGLFFLGRDQPLQAVLLPGQELPGGGKVQSDSDLFPVVDDTGRVAFLARRQGEKQNSAFLWEQGSLSRAVVVGADAPGGGKISSVSGVFLNDQNRGMLVSAGVGGSSRHGLYRMVDGTLTALAAPGQTMPDGGTFSSIKNIYSGSGGVLASEGVSGANGAGEHLFLTTLNGGATAAYKVGADGQVSLILKSGTATDLGTITEVGGYGLAGLNTSGQVALSVKINGGADTIVLLTPAAPQ